MLGSPSTAKTRPQADAAVALRRRWQLAGQVQGVGLRPFVYRVALAHGVTGFVLNDTRGATVEAQGTSDQLDRFGVALIRQAPPLARFTDLRTSDLPPLPGERGFEIRHSDAHGRRGAAVTVDTATCPACMAEACDPGDRRHRYGLINCTDCGPRYSIVHDVPYDRPNTVMARFAMCEPCRGEYVEPGDRRFHAQPIACHDCGPDVSLVDARGRAIAGDPYAEAARRLAGGGIVAIKGMGGYHLACRADDDVAVRRVRAIKRRDRKPFALMCRDAEAAMDLVRMSPGGAVLLASATRPIVLAPRRSDAPVAESVAADGHRYGVMLPSTAMHHLLMREPACPQPLVMTSGNVTDEPLIFDNDDALTQLGAAMGDGDALLWHDRPIARGLDDSVFIDTDGAAIPVRRARGYVPVPLALGGSAAAGAVAGPGWCVGGELKNTVAMVRDGEAILSQHMGELTDARVFDRYAAVLEDMAALFDVEPRWIAHDLHPQYVSTMHARRVAAQRGLALIGVQHHHAHAAAVMAEHDLHEPVLAVVCDGVGYGQDGGVWGGELLRASRRDFVRLARLRPLALPGGDASARDTRRCAAALGEQVWGEDWQSHPAMARLFGDERERRTLGVMMRRGVGVVPSSAAGRYFDAVAAMLGLCLCNDFEARAGLRLEAAAADTDDASDLPAAAFALHDDAEVAGLRRIDLSPMTRTLLAEHARGREAPVLARWFHEQLAAAFEAAVVEAAQRTGLGEVVLSGGVFCNALLTHRLEDRLGQRGLKVYRHEQVPPNDGGLALGQAAVALARGGTEQ